MKSIFLTDSNLDKADDRAIVQSRITLLVSRGWCEWNYVILYMNFSTLFFISWYRNNYPSMRCSNDRRIEFRFPSTTHSPSTDSSHFKTNDNMDTNMFLFMLRSIGDKCILPESNYKPNPSIVSQNWFYDIESHLLTLYAKGSFIFS